MCIVTKTTVLWGKREGKSREGGGGGGGGVWLLKGVYGTKSRLVTDN